MVTTFTHLKISNCPPGTQSTWAAWGGRTGSDDKWPRGKIQGALCVYYPHWSDGF